MTAEARSGGALGDAVAVSRDPWRMRLRQVVSVARMEMGKSLRGNMGLIAFGLGALPVALMLIKGLVFIIFTPGDGSITLSTEQTIFANLFDGLILRLVIFFGCVALFVRLFRGDMMSGTLHYYFLQPIQRETLVVGKYLGALAAAVIVFGGATVLARLTMYMPYARSETVQHLLSAAGIGHLLIYVGIAALACAGYGAIFLLVGTLFRNPIVPVLFLLVWESINPFLPKLLKPLSVIWYLQGLIPAPLERGPIEVVAAAAPASVAVPGLVMLAAVAVAIAAVRARRMEIAYGDD